MNLLHTMSIWGIMGFVLLSGAGAYFYYRALAEIRGQKTREEMESFRDDELLTNLQPVVAVAFGRLLPLSAGTDLVAITLNGKDFQLERLSLPIQETRGLTENSRRAFHLHQVLSLAESLRSERLLPGPFPWLAPLLIERRLVDEWPGYESRLEQVKLLANAKRLLYPPLTVKLLPRSIDVSPGAPGSTATSQRTAQESVRDQRRVERKPEDRGLSIERVEAAPEGARPWKGEQRDERAERSEPTPDLPMDLTHSDTPILYAVRTSSRPEENATLQDGATYDEWDCVAGRYRRHYCHIQTQRPAVSLNGESRLRMELTSKRQLVREVTRLFDSLRPIPTRLRRQTDGESIDIDAYVDQRIQMRLGGSFDENIYEKFARLERSVAVSLLLDLSASTERWVGKRRAFEIGIETAALFALGQKVLGDDTEILGFSGSGPSRVVITRFKDFDEPWSEEILDRLDGARPQAFTRLGAAIRHATHSLAQRPTRQRLLLILSDARPQDEDGYEGHYAWADTRKALDEGRKQGITPFCLTLDLESAPVLRLLFRNQYAIHLNPESLVLRLPQIFAHLTQH